MPETKKRTYKAVLEASRAGMSPESVHQGKCAAKRSARAARKADNFDKNHLRNTNKPTPEQQLARLDFRLGKGIGAGRERKRLLAKIEKGA
jgi:hypothetical protein